MQIAINSRKPASQAERFWRFVSKSDGCWEWTGQLTPPDKKHKGGYARLDKEGAHRVSWRIHKGTIPEGMCVLHKCDNPKCVNPEHLFIGSKAQNSRDMQIKGRAKNANTNKTHCPQGHAYDGVDRVTGWRKCSRCARQSLHQWREKTAKSRQAVHFDVDGEPLCRKSFTRNSTRQWSAVTCGRCLRGQVVALVSKREAARIER